MMYLGIYISDSFISASFIDQDGEVILVKDESINDACQHLTPLKIYTEDSFAYLGNQVDYLIANDYNLDYGKYFIDDLDDNTISIYKDKTNVSWNAVSLLAVFLRKIKANIQVYDDHSIQGGMVTISKPASPSLNSALSQAFNMAGISFCGTIELGKAAMKGSGICYSTSKMVLLYDLNSLAHTISIIRVDDEHGDKTLIFKNQKETGEHLLLQYLMDFLLKKYEIIAKREVKKDNRNVIRLQQLAREVIQKYTSGRQSFIKIIFSFEDPIVELVITRAQIDSLVRKYLSQSMTFLKNCLQAGNMEKKDITKIILTGTSNIHKVILLQLQHLFGNGVHIYHDSPEETIARGIALYANDPIVRELGASLIAAVVDFPEEEAEDGLDLKEMNSQVKTIHINVANEG